ncbi:MAG: ATP-grasp domain-containing protein [Candidatus Zhuqueibacterota bacterium]
MTQCYDFCVATDWEYDKEFIHMIERAAHEKYNMTTFLVEAFNLQETIERVRKGEVQFHFFYDRGSDSSTEFLELHTLMLNHHVPVLDSWEQLKWASDKATMHLEFIAHGLVTPHTIIIPPFNKTKNVLLSIADLANLGRPFIIKPANTTGGGIGVVNGAETLHDVLIARQVYETDKYLLQEKVNPVEKDEKRFWFRVFYCCGYIECCWWDDSTHIYEVLSQESVRMYQLESLFHIVEQISRIIKLNFFSTEIAVDQYGKFIVIDYVNEICDMRLKSSHRDGVPEPVVNHIVNHIVDYVQHKIKG